MKIYIITCDDSPTGCAFFDHAHARAWADKHNTPDYMGVDVHVAEIFDASNDYRPEAEPRLEQAPIGACSPTYTPFSFNWLTDRDNQERVIGSRPELAAPYGLPDGWIPWFDGPMPVFFGTKVDVRHRDGREYFNQAAGQGYCETWDLDEDHHAGIVAYRLSRGWDHGGWIPWSGGQRPVSEDTLVHARYSGSSDLFEPELICAGALRWGWDHGGIGGDIVAYRVVES
jgi:hypothetical protein